MNHVVRFATGDMMYRVYDLSANNYFCFYPTEQRATRVEDWMIVGGSGPYEEATGLMTRNMRITSSSDRVGW